MFKQIPESVEAEKAVLGAILIAPDCINEIVNVLEPKDFYRTAHRLIFTTLVALESEHIKIDYLTLVDRLDKTKKLEKAGGIAFITSLVNVVPSVSNVMEYVKIVKEKSIRRNIIFAAESISALAYEANYDLPETIDKVESMLLSVTSIKDEKSSNIGNVAMEALASIEAIYENKGEFIGLSTGFEDLDNVLLGLKKTDFIILAARPSMGKTAFALNIASFLVLKKNIPVAFFSLEMSSIQLMYRLYASCALITTEQLSRGNLSEKELAEIVDCSEKIASSSFAIIDEVNLNILEIRSKVRKLKKEKNIELLIIDYIQLIQGTKKDSRYQEISEISRALKLLAKELDITIIAISQLSRNVENRQVKKPILSDLKESGSLEQDADIVMFLYREDYYNPGTERKNITDVIIAKNRNGKVDTVPIFFHKDLLRFDTLIK